MVLYFRLRRGHLDDKDFCISDLESAKFVEGLFFYLLTTYLYSSTIIWL